MDIKNFKKDFDIEVFKLNTASNISNNLIMVDKTINKIYTDTNLINIFDMLKEKNLELFAEYVLSPDDWTMLKDDKNEYTLLKLKYYLLQNQKRTFGAFKDIILLFKENIDGYSFKPTDEMIIVENGIKYLNMYKEKTTFKNLKPNINSKFPCCETLLKNILQEGYEHFLDFLAWKKQRPTEIIRSHWIIQDDGATGKTEILGNYILAKLFNVNIIGQDDLTSSFNEYLMEGTILICEEIEGFENEKKVKMLTGAQTLLINGKFKTPFKIKNYSNWIICSNDIKPLRLSIDDTRFNVVGGGVRLMPKANQPWEETFFKSQKANEEFFKKFHKNIKTEIKNMHKYLLARKVNRNKVQINIMTKQKQELLEINFTSEFEFMRDLKDFGISSLMNEYGGNFKENFKNNSFVIINNGTNKGNWIKISYLYKLYKLFCENSGLKNISKNPFFKRLRKTPEFKTIFSISKVISHDGDKQRLLKIINNSNNEPLEGQNNNKNDSNEGEDTNLKKVATNWNKKNVEEVDLS